MNRTKVILSIFLMLFLLLAGLVLPSFWKSQKKEASGNKGREPAKETTETNSDTPMPEYLDFDALKAFFSDSQIASLKGQFPVYLYLRLFGSRKDLHHADHGTKDAKKRHPGVHHRSAKGTRILPGCKECRRRIYPDLSCQ